MMGSYHYQAAPFVGVLSKDTTGSSTSTLCHIDDYDYDDNDTEFVKSTSTITNAIDSSVWDPNTSASTTTSMGNSNSNSHTNTTNIAPKKWKSFWSLTKKLTSSGRFNRSVSADHRGFESSLPVYNRTSHHRQHQQETRKDFVSSMNVEVMTHTSTMTVVPPHAGATTRPPPSTAIIHIDSNNEGGVNNEEPEGRDSFTQSCQVLPRENNSGYEVYLSAVPPAYSHLYNSLPQEHKLSATGSQDFLDMTQVNGMYSIPSTHTSSGIISQRHRRQHLFEQLQKEKQLQQIQEQEQLEHELQHHQLKQQLQQLQNLEQQQQQQQLLFQQQQIHLQAQQLQKLNPKQQLQLIQKQQSLLQQQQLLIQQQQERQQKQHQLMQQQQHHQQQRHHQQQQQLLQQRPPPIPNRPPIGMSMNDHISLEDKTKNRQTKQSRTSRTATSTLNSKRSSPEPQHNTWKGISQYPEHSPDKSRNQSLQSTPLNSDSEGSGCPQSTQFESRVNKLTNHRQLQHNQQNPQSISPTSPKMSYDQAKKDRESVPSSPTDKIPNTPVIGGSNKSIYTFASRDIQDTTQVVQPKVGTDSNNSTTAADFSDSTTVKTNKAKLLQSTESVASSRSLFSFLRRKKDGKQDAYQKFTRNLQNKLSKDNIFTSSLSIENARPKGRMNRSSSDPKLMAKIAEIKDEEKWCSGENKCNCSGHHGHCFLGSTVNNDLQKFKEIREEKLMISLQVSEKDQMDDSDAPWNIFWIPTLSFHPFVHGDPLVEFSSLWPSLKELRSTLQNPGVQLSVLRNDACMRLCTLAVTCGPVRLLKCLLDLRLIRVDQLTHRSSGLLHLAVLARNEESVHYLMASKVSPSTRDASGLTADQVCFSPHIRKQLAPRYILGKDVSKERTLLRPSHQDRESIFKLATSPESFVDLQKKLQTLDFNVNTDCDSNGDFLLHIACTKGLSQLPLLMALIKIQGADIELCNVQGLTALMMAAAEGNFVLCDILICLFGANPNKPNSLCGRGALHYAVEGNHRKTVECLIRRGADVNMEDHNGLRPDDIPGGVTSTDDCCEVIQFNRNKRLEMLAEVVKQGEVVSSQLMRYDLCVVDVDNHTLIMTAAIYNRPQSLYILLNVSTTTINAQHSRTGMTALAIAAQMGNSQAVYVLLKYDACPTVADMNGYIPLHHAVLNNHEATVDIFLNFFPNTYLGLYKACRLCKKTSIHEKLYQAWEKRQLEIVTPKLLACSLNGNAEELYQLLDDGDNINPKSGTGNWPLYLAVENGHLDVVQLICDRGGDICKRHPTTGATALHVAAKMGHLSIVTYLLRFCHTPSHRQKKVMTSTTTTVNAFPFSIPSTSYIFNRPTGERSGNDTGSESSTQKQPEDKICRKRKMDINLVEKNDRTALQLAAERGYSRIVEKLLAHGATTAILDSHGNLVTCPQYEGVRIMIESHRRRHMQAIINCILDKSKKALSNLEDLWLPGFDHNLRTKEGQTPLMLAAWMGRLPILKFLLASSVYKGMGGEEEEDFSDADSGVLDPSSEYPKSKDKFNFNQSDNFTDEYKEHKSSVVEDGDYQGNTQNLDLYNQRRLDQMLTDARRPKGMAIYQNGIISHVCAINLLDGTTCLHQAVVGADNPQVLDLLLNTDLSPLNFQDNKGQTVLHLACQLSRKKCVARVLECPGIDVNIRTLDGLLPEELTNQKSIHKLVEKARMLYPPPPITVVDELPITPSHSLVGSYQSANRTTSTINFDQLHSRYEELKTGCHQPLINSFGSSLI